MHALAFVDLETTGANPLQDRITEVGIVTVAEDGLVREWNTLVNPGTPISSFIEQLTGISDAMVANAPRFADIAEEVLERLTGHLFIAHNARFDYGFLRNEFQRLGRNFRTLPLCTVKLSRKLFPEHAKHNLDALMARHGLHAETRHRALSDARLIHQFWQRIQEYPGPETVALAVAAQLSQSGLPPHLDEHLADDLPETIGVYIFYAAERQPLYVGRAKNLKKDILTHFNGNPRPGREKHLAPLVRDLEWRQTAGEVGARLLELSLLQQLLPAHTPGDQETACTWQLDEMGNSWLKPRLALLQEQDFSLGAPCYGLFKNTREALRSLRKLATEQRLCNHLLGLENPVPGQACTGLQQKICKGACIGRELPGPHSLRLQAGLTKLKLLSWPFPGPALLREGQENHLIQNWRYLGPVTSPGEMDELLAARLPKFDREIYQILTKAVGKMTPANEIFQPPTY